MRRLLIFIPAIFCLVGCSETETQTPINYFPPVALQKRKAPAILDRTFSSPSRGQLTLAYTAPSGTNGKEVWLLLFERAIPAKDRPLNTRFEGYIGSQGPVTLLVAESKPTLRGGRWSVINSVPLGIVSKLRKDYIAVRWLEPAKQKGPVLVVSKLSNGGVNGSTELIAFPGGWTELKPVKQTYQDWMRWDDGATYDFQVVDHKGFLCVTEIRSEYTHEPPGENKSTYFHLWNGSGWE